MILESDLFAPLRLSGLFLSLSIENIFDGSVLVSFIAFIMNYVDRLMVCCTDYL